MENNLNKYHNPSPPPESYRSANPRIELKESCKIIDGDNCEFISLIMESGVLDDSCPSTDFDSMNCVASDDDEVVILSVVKKVAPIVNIDEQETVDPVIEPSLKIPSKRSRSKKDSSKDKRRIKIKKEKNKSYSSDSSIDSRRYSKGIHKRKRTKSPRNSENEGSYKHHYDKKKFKNSYSTDAVKKESSVKQESGIKQEPGVKQEQSTEEKPYFNIYRKYYCKTCKVSMNSEIAYTNHMNGKRHLKALKLEDLVTAEDYANPAVFLNKYPPPPPNVYRVKVQETAESQKVIEQHVKSPCPGLEKVIEIQGLDETRYYCELCEATCNGDSIIPHLTGFPHQLQSLKHFKPEIYESYSHREKREIKSKVLKILKSIEKLHGCGKLTVEKEFVKEQKVKEEQNSNQGDHTSERIEDVPGPSHADQDDKFIESYAKTIIPDYTKADFYCQICDAHMNNKIVWESHIRGKRHISNAKKDPRDEPSKKKTVLVPNARAFLLNALKHVEEPVVGLDHIRETRKPEVSGAMYNCFLCGACSGAEDDIIDHILSRKHRTKYLEKINHPDMTLLKEMNMQENRMDSIIEETCAQVEADIGRGNIEVHIAKNSSTARW